MLPVDSTGYSHQDGPGSENQPLQNDGARRTPLPWSQLSILYLIDLVKSTGTNFIYPFVSQLVRDTGITMGDERKTGYFSGIILSVNFLAETLTVLPLGMASDRIGRKPILLLGPLGVSLVILGFGMSTQFSLLVTFRFLLGAFAGNAGTVKTVIGEITDSTNIADAFSFLPVAWMTGLVIGPFAGGVLSQPAERWPDTLGNIMFLRRHPYFLPCLAVSMLALAVYFLTALTLKETLPTALPQPERFHECAYNCSGYGSMHNCSRNVLLTVEDDQSPIYRDERNPASLKSLLKNPEIQIILINNAFVGFCTLSVQALNPLMWSMPIELGGLGWSSYIIGMTMAAHNLITILQIPFLGRIIRRLGTRKTYVTCLSGLLVSSLSFPVANFFARRSGGSAWSVWVTVVVLLLTQSMKPGALASLQIIMTRSAPNQSSLGTVNGLGQGVTSVMRAVGPFLVSSLHSISLQYRLLDGNAVYYVLAVIVACGIRFGLMLPDHL